MNHRFIQLLLCLSMAVVMLGQQASAVCEKVLVPTVEQSNSDYRRLQSFMSLHAAEEYDRLQRMESSSRSAEASYKVFSAEYNDSTSREEFSERIRRRLDRENYHLDEADARSSLKVGLTDKQVDAWVMCAGAGGLLFSARDVTPAGFTLLVARVLPPGVGAARAEIEISGEKAGQSRTIRETYRGPGRVPYQVRVDPGAAEVRVSGTLMRGFADDLLVNYRATPVAKPEQITVEAKSIYTGGYYRYDSAQRLTVSGEPGGGPSENFIVQVDAPKTARYNIEAMWASGADVELYIYTPPPVVSENCWEPTGWNLHKFPASTGGWTRQYLVRDPEVLGRIVLSKGPNTILFAQRPCGGGKGGGRLPSVAWIRFTEVIE